MLIALNEVFRLLVMPKNDATKEIKGYIPFALTPNEPSEMYVSFYANGIRYDYDVTFNNHHIICRGRHAADAEALFRLLQA